MVRIDHYLCSLFAGELGGLACYWDLEELGSLMRRAFSGPMSSRKSCIGLKPSLYSSLVDRALADGALSGWEVEELYRFSQ